MARSGAGYSARGGIMEAERKSSSRKKSKPEKKADKVSGKFSDENQTPYREIPVNRIDPNPQQPRRIFDKQKLKELAQSIRIYGVLMPISVRPPNMNHRYVLISGERRWRAAKIAGLKTIPALVREDGLFLELALLENLQREDLNPIEEAIGIHKLKELKGCTDVELAGILGVSRTSVSEKLALLRLPPWLIAECRTSDIASKSILYQIVTMKNDFEIQEVWKRFKEGRMKVREARKRKKYHRIRALPYKHVFRDPSYTLTIQFRRSDVEPGEIIDILQAEIDRLLQELRR